ncbi:MAG: 3'-5' exonuclease, partial [Bacteroidota bacterium]
MTTIYLIKGPERADKTSSIIEKMFEKQKQDGAMSYLLLGSSGGFLHDFRERFIQKADAIFNNNFKVINQFVVEELIKYYPNRVHVDREMLAALVLEVLSDNSELKELLNSGIGIVEMFLSYFSVVNEHDPETVFADADGTEDKLIHLFAGLYAKFRHMLDEKNMFSTYDAYRMMSELIIKGNYELESKKQYLFIDGFNDFPKPIRDFLIDFTPLFEEVYYTIPMTLDKKIDDPSFESLIKSFQNGVNRERCQLRTLFIENTSPKMMDRICDCFFENDFGKPILNLNDSQRKFPIHFAKTTNPQDQYRLVGAIVKDLVLKKQIPLDEIGIITRDVQKTGSALSRIFENMGIPYRFEGDVSILDSININRILLPFRVFYKGFEPEMILNFIESGFVNIGELTFSNLQEIFEKAGLLYGKSFNEDYTNRYTTLKIRKSNWYHKLNRYELFLQERIKAQSYTIEDEIDLKARNKETLENIKQVKTILDDMFDTLGILFASSRKRDFRDYFDYFKYIFEKVEQMGLISTDPFEQLSIRVFFENVLPELKRFFVITKKTTKPMISPSEFWKCLSIFMENKQL